jgi:type II secretion system protein D
MRRIGLPLFATIGLAAMVAAVSPAFGQLFTADYPAKSGASSAVPIPPIQPIRQVQQHQQHVPVAGTSALDTVPSNNPARLNATPMHPAQSGNVTFANSGERSNVAFSQTEGMPTLVPRPIAPLPSVPSSNVSSPHAPAHAVPVRPMYVPAMPTSTSLTATPPAAVPAQTARPVAQNAVTKSHQLRTAPQVFEKNLVERLGSRFVPVRGGVEASGLSRYNLPVRDGTGIELVINQQHKVVSITGSPPMVESTLQIVRLLDTEEVPGGSVTRFLPVQQSNIDSARRLADLMNRETARTAQLDRPLAPVANPMEEAAVVGDPSLGRVLGTVDIDVLSDINTIVIQGSPNDVAVVRAMIQQLETLSLENEPIIELVPLGHADSLRVSQLVQTLYQQVYLNRRGAVIMQPLVKPNTILLIGRHESIAAAKELIAKLDTPVNPNAAFRIFLLKHAAANDLLAPVQSFLNRQDANTGLAPRFNVVADIRTNALIVHASPRDLEEVAALIRQLDIPGSEVTSLVHVFPLRNALASTLQPVITNALAGGSNNRGAQLALRGIDPEGNLIRSTVLYNVTIVADTQRNALIVTAPPDAMALIAQLIAQLDQLPSAESKIRVFTLVNGDAFALTTLLNNIFTTGTGTGVGAAAGTQAIATVRPGFEEGDSTLVSIRFQAEIRTNSIVAIGSENDLAIAEALLIRLDTDNLDNRRIFTKRLINVPAEEIAPALNSYITTERQIDVQNLTTYLPYSPQEQYMKEVSIIAEPINNFLIISTTPRYYEQIKRIIEELDERPMMVAIEVLIAEVDITRNKDRGMEIGLKDSILPNLSLNARPDFGLTGSGNVGTQGVTSLMPASNGITGFSFSASGESVSMYIRALETQKRTQILARPNLVTLDNRRAQISVGQTIMYSGGSTMSGQNVIQSVEERQVGTVLDIVPRIMPDGMIALAVYVERSSIATWESIGDRRLPILNDTNASTTINAMDGQTVVFAGLISETKGTTNNSIPGLNKIPLIKHLFEYDAKNYERKELLIVLTPRIIRTRADIDILNQQERERMSWCVRDVVKLTGDRSIMRRSDEWYPNEVRHVYGTPVILHETQLPSDSKVMPMPMFPVIETK